MVDPLGYVLLAKAFLLVYIARCSSVVRAFAHGVMGRWIDPSWWTHWGMFTS